jgi:C4-dicarboxylate-specific signal transduction histidine kinase
MRHSRRGSRSRKKRACGGPTENIAGFCCALSRCDDRGSIVEWYATSTDIEDLKRAEEELRRREARLRDAQMELAHANRVTATGQLAASIAHEVSQPIAAALTNANAAWRWLGAELPDLEEVRQALGRIIRDGRRAGDIIGRIRALVRRAPPQNGQLDINQTMLEVIALTRSELRSNRTSLQTKLADGLPLVLWDRIQLQQVMPNPILNAVEAMSRSGEMTRELLIRTEQDGPGGVLVTVQVSGPGLKPDSLDRLFDAFYTTKSSGIGMGLSICRSIIEAHGGRVWATPNLPQGAAFQFSLPQQRGDRVLSRRTPRGRTGCRICRARNFRCYSIVRAAAIR